MLFYDTKSLFADVDGGAAAKAPVAQQAHAAPWFTGLRSRRMGFDDDRGVEKQGESQHLGWHAVPAMWPFDLCARRQQRNRCSGAPWFPLNPPDTHVGIPPTAIMDSASG